MRTRTYKFTFFTLITGHFLKFKFKGLTAASQSFAREVKSIVEFCSTTATNMARKYQPIKCLYGLSDQSDVKNKKTVTNTMQYIVKKVVVPRLQFYRLEN